MIRLQSILDAVCTPALVAGVFFNPSLAPIATKGLKILIDKRPFTDKFLPVRQGVGSRDAIAIWFRDMHGTN